MVCTACFTCIKTIISTNSVNQLTAVRETGRVVWRLRGRSLKLSLGLLSDGTAYTTTDAAKLTTETIKRCQQTKAGSASRKAAFSLQQTLNI